MSKNTKAKTNRTATGQNPGKATPEKAEQKHAIQDKPASLPLNREKREELIKWWRSQGWTYEQISSKFAAGVTEAEYEEYKKQWEA